MTQGQGTAKFSPKDVEEIRRQWDAGTISVRAWADEYGCSPETVRKIGRRDTYRNVSGGKAATAAVPPSIPGQTFPKGIPEPTLEEIEASTRKFAQMLKSAQGKETAADEAIAELEKRND